MLNRDKKPDCCMQVETPMQIFEVCYMISCSMLTRSIEYINIYHTPLSMKRHTISEKAMKGDKSKVRK